LHDSKTLWALGNYARFIRPGMKRIDVNLNQANTYISGFKDDRSIVFVIVNTGEEFQVNPDFKNANTYTTSENQNLAYMEIKAGGIRIPKASVVTILIPNK
jgi:O-glycosyl hydrolase